VKRERCEKGKERGKGWGYQHATAYPLLKTFCRATTDFNTVAGLSNALPNTWIGIIQQTITVAISHKQY